MKTKLLAILLLAGSSMMFAGPRFSIGVGIGVPSYGYYGPAYVAPRPPVAYVAAPGPGYNWVPGYWIPGPRRYWHAGYWAPPVYGRGYVVAPRYYNRGYGYRGYYR